MRKEVGYYEDFFLIMSSKATHDKEGIVSFFFPHFASFYLLLFVSNRNITRELLGKPSSLSQTFLGSWFLGSFWNLPRVSLTPQIQLGEKTKFSIQSDRIRYHRSKITLFRDLFEFENLMVKPFETISHDKHIEMINLEIMFTITILKHIYIGVIIL